MVDLIKKIELNDLRNLDEIKESLKIPERSFNYPEVKKIQENIFRDIKEEGIINLLFTEQKIKSVFDKNYDAFNKKYAIFCDDESYAIGSIEFLKYFFNITKNDIIKYNTFNNLRGENDN